MGNSREVRAVHAPNARARRRSFRPSRERSARAPSVRPRFRFPRGFESPLREAGVDLNDSAMDDPSCKLSSPCEESHVCLSAKTRTLIGCPAVGHGNRPDESRLLGRAICLVTATFPTGLHDRLIVWIPRIYDQQMRAGRVIFSSALPIVAQRWMLAAAGCRRGQGPNRRRATRRCLVATEPWRSRLANTIANETPNDLMARHLESRAWQRAPDADRPLRPVV